jgi:hypothetical protein
LIVFALLTWLQPFTPPSALLLLVYYFCFKVLGIFDAGRAGVVHRSSGAGTS